MAGSSCRLVSLGAQVFAAVVFVIVVVGLGLYSLHGSRSFAKRCWRSFRGRGPTRPRSPAPAGLAGALFDVPVRARGPRLVAVAPSGVGFTIETKTMSFDAHWLLRVTRRRVGPSAVEGGAVAGEGRPMRCGGFRDRAPRARCDRGFDRPCAPNAVRDCVRDPNRGCGGIS